MSRACIGCVSKYQKYTHEKDCPNKDAPPTKRCAWHACQEGVVIQLLRDPYCCGDHLREHLRELESKGCRRICERPEDCLTAGTCLQVDSGGSKAVPSGMSENRETFFRRLEPFFAPSTLLDVQLAYTMAKFSHRSQLRKELDAEGRRIRYFEHVRRVAIVLIDEVKIISPEFVISALLHDGIEDTRDLTPEMIEHCFGEDVARIVKTLSKVPKEGYLERFQMCSDWRPYVIKACDRLDNLRSLADSSPEFRKKQVEETIEKYYPLFDRMIQLAPTEARHQCQMIRDLVIKTCERQAALVG